MSIVAGLEKEEKSEQIPATLTDFLKYFRNTLRKKDSYWLLFFSIEYVYVGIY